MNNHTNKKHWHVAQWPPLAWLETAIKAAALIVGISALLGALSAGDFELPSGLRLAQLIVQAILSLGLVAAIFDRILEREIVAMIFVPFNNLGHWGLVVALASVSGPGSALVFFALLMLIGDLVKLAFIKVHDFKVRDTPRSVLYGLTGFYAAGYGLLLLLEFLR